MREECQRRVRMEKRKRKKQGLGVPCWEFSSGFLVGPMEKPGLPLRVCQFVFLVKWQPTNSSPIWF